MSKLRRVKVNRRRSVSKFNRGAKKTHRKNIGVMRGGYRL